MDEFSLYTPLCEPSLADFRYVMVNFKEPSFHQYSTARGLLDSNNILFLLVKHTEVTCFCSHLFFCKTRYCLYFFIKPIACLGIALVLFKSTAQAYSCLLFVIVYPQISHSYFGMKSLCIQVVKYHTFSY